MAYKPNPGRVPDDCVVRDDAGAVTGFRSVHVRLFNGIDSKLRGDPPWPAGGGRPPTDWSISQPEPHPFQIKEWILA